MRTGATGRGGSQHSAVVRLWAPGVRLTARALGAVIVLVGLSGFAAGAGVDDYVSATVLLLMALWIIVGAS